MRERTPPQDGLTTCNPWGKLRRDAIRGPGPAEWSWQPVEGRRDSMADAPVPVQLSPRSERTNLVVTCLVCAALLAYCLYGAFSGELRLPARDDTVVIRGWARSEEHTSELQ